MSKSFDTCDAMGCYKLTDRSLKTWVVSINVYRRTIAILGHIPSGISTKYIHQEE